MRSAIEGLILLLWVVLILAQTTTSVSPARNSISGQESTATTGRRLISSPPRKARFHDKVWFHAPSSTPSREFFSGIHGGDPAGELYGEDKRIIHTDGVVETVKETMEIDEANKKVTLTAVDGHVLEQYKFFQFIFQVTPKNDEGGNQLKITAEYEKLKESDQPPQNYLYLLVTVMKDIDAHLIAS